MATGLSTQDKALKINLDPQIYGSFAEIGAGQEVARWFFRAGAASKTVAKTISAYDMTVSDSIYGPEKSGRYVCESRLSKMLDHEYGLLIDRLGSKRGANTCFFSFADTVAATSFKRADQEGRGWLGVRFQRRPQADYNEIIMHVRMFDRDPIMQQEELGILGVNLIYGAFNLTDSPEEFLSGLTENLKDGSIEIEMISCKGPDLKHIDNRLLALSMMELGLTNAVLFSPKGEVLQPSEVLFRKNVIVQRGSFRPFTLLHQDMMLKGREQFCNQKEGGCDIQSTILLMEMTTKNLLQDGFINYRDFLDRVEMLNSLGHFVLISDFAEYYKLRQYLSRYTHEQVGILMGAIHLDHLFDSQVYKDLKGGILEAFSLLFSDKTTMFIYPAKQKDGSLLTLKSYKPNKDFLHLFQHFCESGQMTDLKNANTNLLDIFSRDLSKQISGGEPGWEKQVPAQVAEIIKSKKLFV